jgi:cysteinyl-tRNA synthetase
VENRKMSKSLGNLYTLEDVAKRGYEPADLRLVLLSGHYRQPLNFSWDTMQAARHGREKLGRVQTELAKTAAGATSSPPGWGSFGPAWEALREDLETPKALGALYTAAAEVDRKRRQGMKAAEAVEELGAMERILGVLGVAPYFEKDVEIPPEMQKLAEAREAARKAKEWGESDRLRDELAKAGWEVRDGAEGWRLVRKAGGA